MKGALQDIKKRPILLLFIMTVGAVLCAVEQFNSITQKYGSINGLFASEAPDYTEFLADAAEFIQSKAANPWLMLVSVLIAVTAAIAVAAIFGVAFSGFAYTNYVTILERTRGKSRQGKSTAALFAEGINSRFVKMTVYFAVLILGGVLMIVMTAYSLMPSAVAVKNVIAGDTGAIFSMVLLVAVTALILFFAIIFFAMYISFMMPSIIAFKNGSVQVAVKMVNGYCWYLIPRTLGFLLYMVATSFVMLLLSYGGNSAGGNFSVFVLNWILKSAGLYVYTQYVFSTYIAMKDDMFEE